MTTAPTPRKGAENNPIYIDYEEESEVSPRQPSVAEGREASKLDPQVLTAASASFTNISPSLQSTFEALLEKHGGSGDENKDEKEQLFSKFHNLVHYLAAKEMHLNDRIKAFETKEQSLRETLQAQWHKERDQLLMQANQRVAAAAAAAASGSGSASASAATEAAVQGWKDLADARRRQMEDLELKVLRYEGREKVDEIDKKEVEELLDEFEEFLEGFAESDEREEAAYVYEQRVEAAKELLARLRKRKFGEEQDDDDGDVDVDDMDGLESEEEEEEDYDEDDDERPRKRRWLY